MASISFKRDLVSGCCTDIVIKLRMVKDGQCSKEDTLVQLISTRTGGITNLGSVILKVNSGTEIKTSTEFYCYSERNTK